MLAMTDINTIRNLRNNHDKSINHIAEELEINWRTAKKYADEDLLPEPKIRKKTGMMYVEHWGGIVALWLSEDSKLPKKKRRTIDFMTKELKNQGFPGSYRTVCDFVRDWKATHYVEANEDQGFERLEHPPAEAQLDFGTMEVCHEGAFKPRFPKNYNVVGGTTPKVLYNCDCFFVISPTRTALPGFSNASMTSNSSSNSCIV